MIFPIKLVHPDVMDFRGGPTCQRKLTSAKRSSRSRVIDVLRQGNTIAVATRQIRVSEVTFHRWRKEYGMETDQLKRLKELEKENKRLRRAVSDKTHPRQGNCLPVTHPPCVKHSTGRAS